MMLRKVRVGSAPQYSLSFLKAMEVRPLAWLHLKSFPAMEIGYWVPKNPMCLRYLLLLLSVVR
jgi:hypothetical protein